MNRAAEIRIAANDNIERVRDRLALEVGFLNEKGVAVETSEERCGDTTFFTLGLAASVAGDPETEHLELFRHHLANAISDIIVNDWERTLLARMIKANCDGLGPAEQATVLSAASRNLDYRADGRPDLLRRVTRKGQVLKVVEDYLTTQAQVNIDGLVTFRLRDYCDQLNEAVGRAIDDFVMEKEYVEFISLLRYFVEAQESKLELVHVVILPKRGFRLIDDKGSTINGESLAESFPGLEMEINPEDLLVSALITIAPQKVVLHCPVALDRMEYLETIKQVFEGRISVCRGCHLCRGQRREPDRRSQPAPTTSKRPQT